jgi:hypothetical protein
VQLHDVLALPNSVPCPQRLDEWESSLEPAFCALLVMILQCLSMDHHPPLLIKVSCQRTTKERWRVTRICIERKWGLIGSYFFFFELDPRWNRCESPPDLM